MKKHKIIEALLSTGSVFIAIDPTRGGVAGLPRDLAKKDHVVLQVGYNLPLPIPDLSIRPVYFSGTLSFGGKPHEVVVQWSAAYSAWDEYGTVVQWHDLPTAAKGLAPAPVAEAPKPKSNVVSFADYKRRMEKEAGR